MFNTKARRLASLCCIACLALAACTADNEADSSAPPPPSAGTPASGSAVDRSAPAREVVAESLAYGEVDDTLVYGHFAIPADMVDPLPAVIVIHDWWGLNDGMRETCERLAAQGYIVLGVDMFGGATASVASEARKLEIDVIESPQLALANLEQAADFVLDVARAPDIAILGYGFGGSWALNAALDRGERLSAVAMFYGQVSSDRRRLGNLNTPVLGFFAANDRAVPATAVEAFEEALAALEKERDIRIFPNARRGFADRASDNFDAALDEQAWNRLLEFLATTLNRPATN